MANVFISYASEDQERARRLAHLLEARGWSVWWDRKILAGQTFDQVIEHEIETAQSVVVLWSKHSTTSEWVRNEAAFAEERGVLVPALIDRVKLPLAFRRKQTADLVGWNGDPSDESFQTLCDGIASKITPAPGAMPPLPVARPAFRWNRRGMLGVIAVLAAAMGLYWGWTAVTHHPASEEASKLLDLADLAVGTYFGDVVSDAKGDGRSDVTVTITKVDERKVRITSDYERLGVVEVDLSRVGTTIQGLGDGPLLRLELERDPPRLSFNPNGEVAYVGKKQ